jgi:hypothetical protein
VQSNCVEKRQRHIEAAHHDGVSHLWHNSNVEKFELDLNKARKSLAQAGYAWDEKGAIYYPKGKIEG